VIFVPGCELQFVPQPSNWLKGQGRKGSGKIEPDACEIRRSSENLFQKTNTPLIGHARTNHDRFASVFKNSVRRTFSTAEIVKLMSADSDIQIGNILPNDHGEGNKGECPCIGTERQIFERVDRGMYRVRDFRS
jgi:hypothetical protein